MEFFSLGRPYQQRLDRIGRWSCRSCCASAGKSPMGLARCLPTATGIEINGHQAGQRVDQTGPRARQTLDFAWPARPTTATPADSGV